ncbi:pyridoxamine 5'-phosphate oxidase family protein [Salinispora mooreana]|uniref:pyridoxamine 5'-phosphate oxidase family protein n=1 Tax=Salinispora mooreana TaxID=999545 RepID=UPI0003749BCD|nr:pyridoxamine 5'-phosphate oxidase family protein [Salinispora mooreana]
MDIDAATRRAVRAATVGEFGWLDSAGRPHARPVTPLLLDDEPAIAFPYAEAALARRLATAPEAALVISDDRLTGRDWRAVVMRGRPRLIEDRDGTLFSDRLLLQELRKYPPARAFLDSPLLRREHWWYLPRLIVPLAVTTSAPVGVRRGGHGEVLVVSTADRRLAVETVRRLGGDKHRIRVASLTGGPLPTGAAVLLEHDFSRPDLERWTPWLTRGRLTGDRLAVAEAPHRAPLAPPLGMWQRLTRHRRLARACRRALNGEADAHRP